MKVFLGNAPWNKKGFYGVRAGSRWPHFEVEQNDYMPFPFFLAYAAALLEENGTEISLVDGIAEKISEREFVNRIESFSPDLIVLEVSTISIRVDLALGKKLRNIVGRDVKIAFCGLHADMSKTPFLTNHPFLDFVLVGEYEYTLRDLVAHLENDGCFENVPGLIFRDARGIIQTNGRRGLIANLNELPWPARQYLPMENYHDEPGSIPRPSVQIQASRGCPFGCIFCAWPQIIYGNRRYRTRDPLDVVDEFEWLVRTWGFKSVYFDDDTFNIGKSRIYQICEALQARHLETPWAAMCRADTMTQEIIETMAASGLCAVKYGVESAHQGILEASGKHLNIKRVKETVKHTHELGIKTHLTFMFGLPGETKETAKRTIELALDLNPESVQFTIATPFPGSRFFDLLEERGLITDHDFSKFDGFRSAVVRTEALTSKDLEDIVADANASWQRNISRRSPTVSSQSNDHTISIVIPNYNGKTFLRPCLDSLMRQTRQADEIILVDNASTDGSLQMVYDHFTQVRVIRMHSNRGFSEAVNQGIRTSEGALIAVLNNDTVADPKWVETACKYLAKNPGISFCASKIIRYHDPHVIDSAGHGITQSGYTFNIGNGARDRGQYDHLREVFGAPAAAAIYRRSMFKDIGLFDEDFRMYLEDVDLSFRAQLRGHRCMLVPGARVRHHCAGTTGTQYHRDNVYFIARNSVYVLIKNMPKQKLVSNFFRIAGFMLYLQVYHTFKTFHACSCMKGICNGLYNAHKMVVKRRWILGGKRVSIDRVTELLRLCEADYNRLKIEKAK